MNFDIKEDCNGKEALPVWTQKNLDRRSRGSAPSSIERVATPQDAKVSRVMPPTVGKAKKGPTQLALAHP